MTTLVDIQAALNLMSDKCMIEYDSTLNIQSEIVDTETQMVKADAYHKLSAQAIEMIDAVINRPDDLIEYCIKNSASYIKHKSYRHQLQYEPSLSLEKRLIDLNIIKAYFKEKWNIAPRKVSQVASEISEFCSCF